MHRDRPRGTTDWSVVRPDPRRPKYVDGAAQQCWTAERHVQGLATLGGGGSAQAPAHADHLVRSQLLHIFKTVSDGPSATSASLARRLYDSFKTWLNALTFFGQSRTTNEAQLKNIELNSCHLGAPSYPCEASCHPPIINMQTG